MVSRWCVLIVRRQRRLLNFDVRLVGGFAQVLALRLIPSKRAQPGIPYLTLHYLYPSADLGNQQRLVQNMDNHDRSIYLLVLIASSLPVESRISKLCDLVVPLGAGSPVWEVRSGIAISWDRPLPTQRL